MQKPRVGIIHDVRGDPPYASVNKLWLKTIKLLSQEFSTHIFETQTFDVNCTASRYIEFIQNTDVLFLMSPYYKINRSIKEVPCVFYGLGSLQKGGHWLYHNSSSFRAYDSLILNCTACDTIFSRLVSGRKMTSYIVPFGIDTNIYMPTKNKEDLRRKYKLPEHAFILIYSGRINLQKNSLLILSVFESLPSKQGIHLVFVGDFDNFYIPDFSTSSPPDVRDEFNKLVNVYNLEDSVSYFQHQNDETVLGELLAASDVGINLSTLTSENFGFTQIEMQACGLPVICSDWADMHDTVLDSQTGFHLETVLTRYGVRVHYEKAREYVQLLRNDRKLSEQMGAVARLNAENYSLDVFSKCLSDVVQKTWAGFQGENDGNIDLQFHPSILHIYSELQNRYANERHISWEHLHPKIDYEHYELILSACATKQAADLSWTQNIVVSKAFPWKMLSKENFLSLDPRWDPLFELADLQLSEDELYLMWNIDQGIRTVTGLISKMGNNVFSILASLAKKGMILC